MWHRSDTPFLRCSLRPNVYERTNRLLLWAPEMTCETLCASSPHGDATLVTLLDLPPQHTNNCTFVLNWTLSNELHLNVVMILCCNKVYHFREIHLVDFYVFILCNIVLLVLWLCEKCHSCAIVSLQWTLEFDCSTLRWTTCKTLTLIKL